MSAIESRTSQRHEQPRTIASGLRLSREALVELLFAGLGVSVVVLLAATVMLAGSTALWVLSPFAFTAWATTGVISIISAFIFEWQIIKARQ